MLQGPLPISHLSMYAREARPTQSTMVSESFTWIPVAR